MFSLIRYLSRRESNMAAVTVVQSQPTVTTMTTNQVPNAVTTTTTNPVVPMTTMIQESPPSEIKEWFARKQSFWLGILQVILGVLCVIVASVALGIEAFASESGTGIWCGVLFAVTGGFAISAANYRTNCHIVTLLVLAILSCVSAFILFCVACAGTSGDRVDNWSYYWDLYRYHQSRPAQLSMNVMLLIMSVAEFGLALWSSILCCNGCCSYSSPGTVIQTTTVAQPQVTVTQTTVPTPNMMPQAVPQYAPAQHAPMNYPAQPPMNYPAQPPMGYAAPSPPYGQMPQTYMGAGRFQTEEGREMPPPYAFPKNEDQIRLV